MRAEGVWRVQIPDGGSALVRKTPFLRCHFNTQNA
eukprot:COSAG06_NODE_3923_length_4760_cov_2.841270_1_plen_34_part_10